MKKFYFLAMMAMLAFSTTSCQKDDFSDAPQQTFTSFAPTTSTATTSTATTTLPTPTNKVDFDKLMPGTWTATLEDGTVCTLTVSNKDQNGFLGDEFKATLTVGEKSYTGQCTADEGYVRFFSDETGEKGNFVMGFSGKWVEGNKSFRAEVMNLTQPLGATYFSK